MPVKAILLADERHRNYHASGFFCVYSDDVLDRLRALVDLEEEPVFWGSSAQKREALASADIILSNWGMPELSAQEVQRALPNVRAVFYAGGDVHAFAAPYFQQGARVFCTQHTNAIPASEYALSQILQATKGVQRAGRAYLDPQSYAQARQEVSQRPGNYMPSVGILGVGHVGSRVAQLLRPFDVHVLGCDPFLSPARALELGITLVEQDELFRRCDVVSCHLPDWSILRAGVGYAEFSAMPPCATFINAAQALPIDQDALIRALNEVPTRTAILDSTDPMPLPAGHPLLTMPNVFLTPHIAGSFGGELERMGFDIVQMVSDYISGRPCAHEVLREGIRRFT